MQRAIHFPLTESYEPLAALVLYGFILVVLVFSISKIWLNIGGSGTALSFLLFAKGRLYLTFLVLGLIFLYVMITRTHSGFWTFDIIDTDHLALNYWFPRADRLLQPPDIQEFGLVTIQHRSKTEVVNQYWTISLVDRKGGKSTSIEIYSEKRAKQAIATLENWVGRPYIHYLRECPSRYRIACQTS